MNPNQVKLEKIADLLEKQALDNSITDGTIWHSLALSKRTFYRLKPDALQILHKRATLRQQAIDNTKLQDTIHAAKKGLKSKTERVLLLQQEIDACIKELYSDETARNYAVVGGKLVNVKNQLTIEQKVALRKTIREYQAEISKIEGDYAPNQIEDVTGYQVIRPKRR